jgi:hypothetical protein
MQLSTEHGDARTGLPSESSTLSNNIVGWVAG